MNANQITCSIDTLLLLCFLTILNYLTRTLTIALALALTIALAFAVNITTFIHTTKLHHLVANKRAFLFLSLLLQLLFQASQAVSLLVTTRLQELPASIIFPAFSLKSSLNSSPTPRSAST